VRFQSSSSGAPVPWRWIELQRREGLPHLRRGGIVCYRISDVEAWLLAARLVGCVMPHNRGTRREPNWSGVRLLQGLEGRPLRSCRRMPSARLLSLRGRRQSSADADASSVGAVSPDTLRVPALAQKGSGASTAELAPT
jgi:hypothetical protein